MIALPAGTHVWLAAGITDMRKGMDGLAALVQAALGERPFSGDVFVFRGKRGDVRARIQDGVDVVQVHKTQQQAGQHEHVYLRTWIEKIKLELARLRRLQFGRSSEQLGARIEQLELIVDELQISAAQPTPATR